MVQNNFISVKVRNCGPVRYIITEYLLGVPIIPLWLWLDGAKQLYQCQGERLWSCQIHNNRILIRSPDHPIMIMFRWCRTTSLSVSRWDRLWSCQREGKGVICWGRDVLWQKLCSAVLIVLQMLKIISKSAPCSIIVEMDDPCTIVFKQKCSCDVSVWGRAPSRDRRPVGSAGQMVAGQPEGCHPLPPGPRQHGCHGPSAICERLFRSVGHNSIHSMP